MAPGSSDRPTVLVVTASVPHPHLDAFIRHTFELFRRLFVTRPGVSRQSSSAGDRHDLTSFNCSFAWTTCSLISSILRFLPSTSPASVSQSLYSCTWDHNTVQHRVKNEEISKGVIYLNVLFPQPGVDRIIPRQIIRRRQSLRGEVRPLHPTHINQPSRPHLYYPRHPYSRRMRRESRIQTHLQTSET